MNSSSFHRYLQLSQRAIDDIFLSAYCGDRIASQAAYLVHQRHGTIPECVHRYVEHELARMGAIAWES